MSHANSKNVVVRFPPSPTGNLQLGNARTLLFNFLFAKKHGGKIIFRIEDTDRERSKKEFEEGIIEDLAWLGLSYDETHRQSERSDIHKRYLKKMVEEGKAYVSKEEAAEGKRAEVIRFKNPGRDVSFVDGIRGLITVHTGDLGDFVIAKDFDTPLYHLAVTIDDFEMGITHVIRGEDHISNTPRQILLLESFGAPIPEYTHLPLVLAADRSKLSKRNGSVSIKEMRERGFLPEAVINALAVIGWTPSREGEEEFFSMDELIKRIEISDLHKNGAVWNLDKLKWFNKHYIKQIPAHEAHERLLNALPEKQKRMAEQEKEKWNRVAPILLERLSYFGEVGELAEQGEVDYYFEAPEYEATKLFWKKDPQVPEETIRRLEYVKGAVDNYNNTDLSSPSNVAETLASFAEAEGRGSVLWPLRFALSGRDKSPDPYTLIYVLGKDEVLSRLALAIQKLSAVK